MKQFIGLIIRFIERLLQILVQNKNEMINKFTADLN